MSILDLGRAVDDVTRQIASQDDTQVHHQAKVTAVTTTGGRASVTIDFGAGATAISVPGVFHNAGYSPTVNDIVVVIFFGSTPFVLCAQS